MSPFSAPILEIYFIQAQHRNTAEKGPLLSSCKQGIRARTHDNNL